MIASGKQLILTLGKVSDNQTLVITLTGVRILPYSTTYTLSIPMAVLIGDTTGDRRVNSTDVSQTTAAGTIVTQSNFRSDVNADGTINAADLALIQSNSGIILH